MANFNANEINYTDYSPWSLEDLKASWPRKKEHVAALSKKELEQAILNYLDDVNSKISTAWRNNANEVVIEVNGVLYDPQKLKTDLESLGFTVEENLPRQLIVKFDN